MPKFPPPITLLLPLLLPKRKSLIDELKVLTHQAASRLHHTSLTNERKTTPLKNPDNKQAYDIHIKDIPIFLPVEIVAPQIDPLLWGDYVSIKTSNAVKTKSWKNGWRGTIQENIDFHLLNTLGTISGLKIGKFENILNIEEYTWNKDGGHVLYSLNRCIAGDLTIDQGGLWVEPQPWGGCNVSCKKKLAFAEKSDWEEPAIKFLMERTIWMIVFMWVIEYSLKIMINALQKNPELENDPKLQKAKNAYREILAETKYDNTMKNFGGK